MGELPQPTLRVAVSAQPGQVLRATGVDESLELTD